MLKRVGDGLLVSICFLFAASSALSQDFNSPVAQFSSKITNRAAPQTASLTVRNQSSLAEAVVFSIRADLERQLAAQGWQLKKADDSENSILVTLGENLSRYVWTAEVESAAGKDIIVFELPRANSGTGPVSGSIALSRALLVGSDTPLLDVALLESKIAEGAHLLALTPTSVRVYLLQSSQWRLAQTQPLGLDPIPNRDPRGRIMADQGSSFDAYLPGSHCTGVVTGALSVNCRASDDPWPLSDERRVLAFYAANRNYFNGVITVPGAEGENVGPFYSAAVLGDRVMFAGTDGHIRALSTGHHSSSAVPAHWGSSIAGMQSSCQTDLVLATAPGDFYAGDSVTAFGATSLDLRAASEPVSFSGAILSLKSSPDRQQGVVVVASRSGRYEAYLLTAHCGA